MAEADGLVAALSEYASKNWGTTEWREFGRGSGTADILSNHERLYRSMSFGDDDYSDCVWELVPVVLREGAGPSIQEKMTLVADFVPDLVSWVSSEASHRTRKRFIATLRYAQSQLPPEWETDAGALLSQPVAQMVPSRHVPLGPRASSPDFVSRPAPTIAGQELNFQLGAAPGAIREGAPKITPQKIFIVHGHDHDAVNTVKVKVHSITGIMPEILADQPGQGDTIIEKFERHADSSDYAIVLLTPDDEGRKAGSTEELQARARQNVILELGYFFGKLGRRRVVVLNGGVEQPSDVHGLNYIAYGSGSWLEELRQELRAAGFPIKA